MSTRLRPRPAPPIFAPQPPRLLDQVAQAARQRGRSEAATAQCISQVRTLARFHDKGHPRELRVPDGFLQQVVRTDRQPLPALESAAAALELPYGTVLGIYVGELPRPRPPRLLHQMSHFLRLRRCSLRTEACLLHARSGIRCQHMVNAPHAAGGRPAV